MQHSSTRLLLRRKPASTCSQPEPSVIGIYRDASQIWGCVGGDAAYTPPNLGTSTGFPKEPELIMHKKMGQAYLPHSQFIGILTLGVRKRYLYHDL
jgi:hypothetical protein